MKENLNMSYNDWFILPVVTKNKQAYLESAKFMSAIFLEHGAIRIIECWGDDVADGKIMDFKRAVILEVD